MGRRSTSFLIGSDLHKKCPKCGFVKPHSDYSKTSGRAHGIASYCKLCASERSKIWNGSNVERHRANVRRWEGENPERVAKVSRDWHEKNREYKNLKASEWHFNNKDRASENRKRRWLNNPEKERENARLFCLRNPDWHRIKKNRRRVAKKGAFISFDIELYNLVEREVYALSKLRSESTGFKWHVDHVIPIKSPSLQSLSGNFMLKSRFVGPLMPAVQGLHNEYNFQVIPAVINLAKSNRTWPDMP